MLRCAVALIVAIMLMVPSSRPVAQDYRLQTGDFIEITVLEDPSLDRQVLIRPDGKVSLPLAGSVRAAGRTPEQLAGAVTGALRPSFTTDPVVTVSLLRLAPPPEVTEIEEEEEVILPAVYILGEIETPGRYEFTPPINVLQALALAGGPSVFAARKRIQIRRHAGGSETVVIFNYDDVEDQAAASGNLTIMDGDVIVVPERGLFR